MRTLSLLVINLLIAGMFMSCTGQTNKGNNKISKDKIDVYYFHYTRRCATCNAVENEAKKAIEKYYPEKYKNGEITFTSVNLDEEEGIRIGKKVGSSTQALLIIKGDKKIDLTSFGFMNARSNPEKYHKKIKETIDGL